MKHEDIRYSGFVILSGLGISSFVIIFATMKALTLSAYHQFDYGDVPDPEIGPEDVLISVKACGICGSDVKQILLHGATDNPLTALISFPHVLGHEAVARREIRGEHLRRVEVLRVGAAAVVTGCRA